MPFFKRKSKNKNRLCLGSRQPANRGFTLPPCSPWWLRFAAATAATKQEKKKVGRKPCCCAGSRCATTSHTAASLMLLPHIASPPRRASAPLAAPLRRYPACRTTSLLPHLPTRVGDGKTHTAAGLPHLRAAVGLPQLRASPLAWPFHQPAYGPRCRR